MDLQVEKTLECWGKSSILQVVSLLSCHSPELRDFKAFLTIDGQAEQPNWQSRNKGRTECKDDAHRSALQSLKMLTIQSCYLK
jgi:hypothetical protein